MAASLHQSGPLEHKVMDGKSLEMSLGVDGFLIYDVKFLDCLQPLFKQKHQFVQDKYTDQDLLSIPKGKVTLQGVQLIIFFKLSKIRLKWLWRNLQKEKNEYPKVELIQKN